MTEDAPIQMSFDRDSVKRIGGIARHHQPDSNAEHELAEITEKVSHLVVRHFDTMEAAVALQADLVQMEPEDLARIFDDPADYGVARICIDYFVFGMLNAIITANIQGNLGALEAEVLSVFPGVERRKGSDEQEVPEGNNNNN